MQMLILKKKQEIKELVASCILHVSGIYIFHLILLGFPSSLFLPSIKEGVGWGDFYLTDLIC